MDSLGFRADLGLGTCAPDYGLGLVKKIDAFDDNIMFRVNRDACRYKKDYPKLSRVPRSQV